MSKVMYMRKGDVHTAPSNFPPIGTSLNDLTWEQIRAISDAGLASSYFAAGDIKNITINGKVGDTTFSNLSIDVFIIGIDHNSNIEENNKIHFQIGKINEADVCLCDSNCGSQVNTLGAFIMNTGKNSAGGWSACHMRTTVLGSDSSPTDPTANTLMEALPSDLRAVMKPVTKYSDNIGGGYNYPDNITATTDYLWLLAEFEVFGSRSSANSAEQNRQAQYDYYKAGNSKIKYKYNAMTTAVNWWLRSAETDSNLTQGFCVVAANGSASLRYSTFSNGIAPCFAV